jgi:NADH:ubiquinone oxidoreductase subunit 3 (subunit A)
MNHIINGSGKNVIKEYERSNKINHRESWFCSLYIVYCVLFVIFDLCIVNWLSVPLNHSVQGTSMVKFFTEPNK